MRTSTYFDNLKFYAELRRIDIKRLDDRPQPSMGCKFFRTKGVTCILLGWNEKFVTKKTYSYIIYALTENHGVFKWTKIPVPKVKNETWKKCGRTLCTITNIKKTVISTEYALVIGGNNPYLKNKEDLKKVYRFNLNYHLKDELKIFDESEIVEVVNIKGKTPLPLMGHVAF